MCALAALLVGIIALFTQLGPSLVSYAINHGLTPPHYDFAVVVAHGAAVPGRRSSSRAARSGARPA